MVRVLDSFGLRYCPFAPPLIKATELQQREVRSMKNCRASLGYSAASLALLVLQACTPSDPPSGKVLCAKTSPACPPGYYCASDQTCWKNGAGPDASAADGAPDSTRDVGNLAALPSDVGNLAALPSDVGASVDLSSDLEDLVDTSTISPDAAFRDGISDRVTRVPRAER
jgi:hypothetical protein